MKKLFICALAAVTVCAASPACKKEDPTVKEKRSGWLLSAPAYMDGTLSYRTYNTGMGLEFDPQKSAGELQVIQGTSRDGFETYLEKVEKNGYDEVVRTETNGNLHVEYEKDGQILYTYYVKNLKEARVIEDAFSAKETDVEYVYELQDGETTTVYQYALMNNPLGNNDGSTPYPDNGMFYIFRQANGNLILIDGGDMTQATDTATTALLDFLYQITGKAKTEKLTVSAIMISHAHPDHKGFIHKLVQNHSANLSIERAFYNPPFWQADEACGADYVAFGKLLKEKFPNIQYVKPHTGQSIQLGEVQMDVLLTHEDLLIPNVAQTMITNFNNSTTVVKYTVQGKTLLQLGDFIGTGNSQERFLQMYKNGTSYPALKADIVQVGHHAMNRMAALYEAIGARYAFVPAADCDFDAYEGQVPDCYQTTINDVIAANADVELYFQSRKTCAFTIAKDGSISISQTDILGADSGYADLFAPYQAFQK